MLVYVVVPVAGRMRERERELCHSASLYNNRREGTTMVVVRSLWFSPGTALPNEKALFAGRSYLVNDMAPKVVLPQ